MSQVVSHQEAKAPSDMWSVGVIEIFEMFFDICLHGGLLRRSLILVWVLLFMMVS